MSLLYRGGASISSSPYQCMGVLFMGSADVLMLTFNLIAVMVVLRSPTVCGLWPMQLDVFHHKCAFRHFSERCLPFACPPPPLRVPTSYKMVSFVISNILPPPPIMMVWPIQLDWRLCSVRLFSTKDGCALKTFRLVLCSHKHPLQICPQFWALQELQESLKDIPEIILQHITASPVIVWDCLTGGS